MPNYLTFLKILNFVSGEETQTSWHACESQLLGVGSLLPFWVPG